MLAKDLTVACYAVGFDPMMGFYHQPRFGRPALALDLMEPFRPLMVELGGGDGDQHAHGDGPGLHRGGRAVALKPGGRKAFFQSL